jgi:hypothetical protein
MCTKHKSPAKQRAATANNAPIGMASKPIKKFLRPCGRATSGSRTVIDGGIGLLSQSSPGISTVSIMVKLSFRRHLVFRTLIVIERLVRNQLASDTYTSEPQSFMIPIATIAGING